MKDKQNKEENKKKISPMYKLIKWLIWLFYPKIEVVGEENLPDKEAIIVSNHTQMNGPIACELHFPGKRYTWCAGEMMELKEVPSYAYEDFWSHKSKYSKPVYKALSYIIAPLSCLIFNNADTIPVYRDSRIISTFRKTVSALENDARIVVFPEHAVQRNNIICEFQDKFVDVARLYYKRTGRELEFVPMYIAPKLKKMYVGKAVRFSADSPIEEERGRICEYLMDEITEIARSLPKHTVIPYQNIRRRDYPKNIIREETK